MRAGDARTKKHARKGVGIWTENTREGVAALLNDNGRPSFRSAPSAFLTKGVGREASISPDNLQRDNVREGGCGAAPNWPEI